MVYSQPCIKNCVIANPFVNNVQTWVDKTNKIKIEFSRSPTFPFVGNVTQLNFRVASLSPDRELELTHIRVTLIKNVTASFNNNNIINGTNNFITFDNLTSNHGEFSLKYRFMEAGAHQIIVKIITNDGKTALGSFNIPILKFWWNLF
jgi:hypothetical protein